MTSGNCCDCGHELEWHLRGPEGWSCHLLDTDKLQCGCWLRSDYANDDIQYYNLDRRRTKYLKELKGKAKK